MEGMMLLLCTVLALCGSVSGFCNGTITELTEGSGNVTEPALPPNSTCKWLVKQGTVYFMMGDLTLPSGDSLHIHNGSDASTANIAIITGTRQLSRPTVVYSWAKGGTLVVLKTGSAETRDIQFNYVNQSCSVSVPALSGGIRGPVYVNGTKANITCTYTISGSPMGSEIVYDVFYSDIDITNGEVVTKVKDENGTVLTKITTGTIEADDAIVSDDVFIKITFNGTSNNSISIDFESVTPDCSGSYDTNLNQTTIITSPGFPRDYDRDLNCVWLITGVAKTTLRVDVNSFAVADQFDRLLINDGGGRHSQSIGSYTKDSLLDSFLLTSTNKLWVHFESDGGSQDQGFNITVTPSAYGGRLHNSGKLELVNKSDSLPNQLNVTDVYYEVVTDEGKQLLFNITNLGLDAGSTVEFLDGFTTTSQSLASFDTSDLTYPVFSNGNQVLVVARNALDNGVAMVNFNATFETVDPSTGKVVLKNSFKDSDGLSVSSQAKRISWYIHPNGSGPSLLDLNKAVLPKGSSLKVYSGLADMSAVEEDNLIGNWTQSVNNIVLMNKGGLRVEFKNPNLNKTALAAASTDSFFAYYTKTQDCDRTLNVSGQLSSPLYPNQYPLNAKCKYNITANKTQFVYMTFSSIDLASANHTINVTSVAGGKQKPVAVYSGNVLPNDTITNGSTLVTFKTRPNGVNPSVGQGFQANYEIIDCGGTVNGAGKIETPKSPKAGTVCRWIVNVPARPNPKSDAVNIINYKFTTSTDKPDSSVLEVRDGPSVRSEVVDVKLTKGTTDQLQSRYNTLWVYYKSKDKSSPAITIEIDIYTCKKSNQCNNGVCLHATWKCNGRDDCGDMTDETGCQYNKSTGIEGWQLALAIILTFLLTIILVVTAPYIYRKFKGNRHDDYTESLVPENM